MRLCFTMAFVTACQAMGGGVLGEPPETVAPGAMVEQLADGFQFTEGPAADRDGNIYFTDQPNDRILKWSVDGELSTFLQPCGRSNGLFFDSSGHLLACADENNQLWSIDGQGKHEVLVDRFEGKLLNGPNDLWIRPDGGLYFTDPFYKRPYWNRGPAEQEAQCVYFLSADRETLRRVADDLQQPNGIVGTPDGKILYVADIRAGRTYAYAIEADGELTGKRLFCMSGSDGMTLDEQGNVYLTGREGVSVFHPEGRKLGVIPLEERWTANVCFGGGDRKTLFITASQGLYAIRMTVRGAY